MLNCFNFKTIIQVDNMGNGNMWEVNKECACTGCLFLSQYTLLYLLEDMHTAMYWYTPPKIFRSVMTPIVTVVIVTTF